VFIKHGPGWLKPPKTAQKGVQKGSFLGGGTPFGSVRGLTFGRPKYGFDAVRVKRVQKGSFFGPPFLGMSTNMALGHGKPPKTAQKGVQKGSFLDPLFWGCPQTWPWGTGNPPKPLKKGSKKGPFWTPFFGDVHKHGPGARETPQNRSKRGPKRVLLTHKPPLTPPSETIYTLRRLYIVSEGPPFGDYIYPSETIYSLRRTPPSETIYTLRRLYIVSEGPPF